MTSDHRCALLIAALGFLRYPPRTLALAALHQWLDSWPGLRLIVVGMERHGYALSLRRVEEKWIASFHHDPTLAPGGFAAAPTPWRAVQQAAWAAVKAGAVEPAYARNNPRSPVRYDMIWIGCDFGL